MKRIESQPCQATHPLCAAYAERRLRVDHRGCTQSFAEARIPGYEVTLGSTVSTLTTKAWYSAI